MGGAGGGSLAASGSVGGLGGWRSGISGRFRRPGSAPIDSGGGSETGGDSAAAGGGSDGATAGGAGSGGAGSGGAGGSVSGGGSGVGAGGSAAEVGAVAAGARTPSSPDPPQAPATSRTARAATSALVPILSFSAIPPLPRGASCLPGPTCQSAAWFPRSFLSDRPALPQRLCTVTGLMSPDGSKPKICPRNESSAAAAATIASAPRKPCCSPSKSR